MAPSPVRNSISSSSGGSQSGRDGHSLIVRPGRPFTGLSVRGNRLMAVHHVRHHRLYERVRL